MSFAQAEAVLADVNSVASDKRTAFQARLKNFLRLGLLRDVQAGRGKAATYEAHHLLLLGLAVEFAQLGIAPETSVALLQKNIDHIAFAIYKIPKNDMEAETWSPHLAYFDPANLSSLMNPEADGEERQALSFAPAERFKADLREILAQGCTRFAVINITGLVVQIAAALERVSALKGWQPAAIYAAALREWAANEYRADTRKMLKRPGPRQARRWIKKSQK